MKSGKDISREDELGVEETRLKTGVLASASFAVVVLFFMVSIDSTLEAMDRTHVSDDHPGLASGLPSLGDFGEGALGLARDDNRVDLAVLVVGCADKGVLTAR